jgi:phage gpG-like protein
VPRITRVSLNNLTITDLDFTPDLIAALPAIKDSAINFGARMVQAKVQEVFDQEGKPGDGWKENAPYTVKWKGHDTILKGKTDHLRSHVEIRKSSADNPQPVGKNQRLIGWFDHPHPKDPDREAEPDFTDAELAALHEDPPWNAKFPARPWLTVVAEHYGDAILDEVAQKLGNAIGGFNLIPIQPGTPRGPQGAAGASAAGAAFRSIFGSDERSGLDGGGGRS